MGPRPQPAHGSSGPSSTASPPMGPQWAQGTGLGGRTPLRNCDPSQPRVPRQPFQAPDTSRSHRTLELLLRFQPECGMFRMRSGLRRVGRPRAPTTRYSLSTGLDRRIPATLWYSDKGLDSNFHHSVGCKQSHLPVLLSSDVDGPTVHSTLWAVCRS